MLSSDLDLLLRTSRGNVPQIVRYHVFRQQELTVDDHEFLERHHEQLEEHDFLEWLCRRPPCPGAVVELLLHRTTPANVAQRYSLHSGSFAEQLDPEVFDDLVERMRSCEDVLIWWSWAQHIRTGCDLYRSLLGQSSESPALAHALFPFRRDEKRLVNALQTLVLTGKAPDGSELPSSPWLHSVPDRPDGDPAAAAASEALIRRANITAFLERQNLLSLLEPRDTLPESVRFSVEDGMLRLRTPEHFFLSLALRWPHPSARTWYVGQFLAAAGRGARWSHLVDEMFGPERTRIDARKGHTADPSVASAVLEQVALDSWNLPEPAPWLGTVVVERMKTGSAEKWDLAFAYLDRVASTGSPDRMARFLAEEVRRADIPLLAEVSVGRAVCRLIAEAPLPLAPDDGFDRKLLSYAPLLRRFAPGSEHAILLRRLANLPRTAERAKRMLSMALANPDSFGGIPASVWEDVAHLAGPVAPERLPKVGEFVRLIHADEATEEVGASSGGPTEEHFDRIVKRARVNEGAAVRVYRRLAGPGAEAALRQWVRSPLDEEGGSARALGLRGLLNNLELVPEALDAELRATIAGTIDALSFAELVEVHEGAPEWVSADRVARAALADISNDRADWPWLIQRPRSWLSRSIVMARAAVTASDDELGKLLDWLRKDGARESDLLPLLLSRVKQDGRLPTFRMTSELARQLGETLSSGTLWRRHGPRVIRSLLESGAWGILPRAVQQSGRGDKQLGEIERDRRGAIVPAAHEAMALVILSHLHAALSAADAHSSSRALRTLLALHAPSRLSGRLFAMRKLTGFAVDVRELFDLNVRMMRHGSARDATLADLESALAIWFEQAEPDDTDGEQGSMNAAQ